jgi:hypothetical protein
MARTTKKKTKRTRKPSLKTLAKTHITHTKDVMQRTLEKKVKEARKEVAEIMKKHAAMAADEVAVALRDKVEETTAEMQSALWTEFADAKQSVKKAFKV